MRNLKRALSLALATVMTMGLMMVGTGASYKDVKTSDNVEAIEVLQTVGIMTGDENGNFNPDKTVTRNEMAVIMANLLNLDYDYYRGTNPFTDVPSWAAPYVAACAAEGVVSGIGNNMYGGEGNVTAAQASLMIMKALGYFQYQADFGDDWQIATIRQASYIDLFAGINATAETALTRNQIAQLVLNGLKADMVAFTGDVGSQVTIGGNSVNIGYRAEYTAKTSAAAKYNSIVGGKTDIAPQGQYYIQLGEELYNGDLKLKSDVDVFGRPARYWEYDGKEIGTYVNYDLMVKDYTTEVTGKDLYDVLGASTIKDYSLTVVIDGVTDEKTLGDAYFDAADMNKNNKSNVGNTGNGVLTQVFVDTENKDITITVINTYLAKADKDYDEKKDELDVTVFGLDKNGTEYVKVNNSCSNDNDDSEGFTIAGEDFDVADLVEDDALLVTVADGEIQSVILPEIVSDVEISAFKLGSSVTVDGTKYSYSDAAEYDFEVLDHYTGAAGSNLKDLTYNVYLDAYGYAIGVDLVETPNNYVFITGIDSNYSSIASKTLDANAIFIDGTSKVISVKGDKGDVPTAGALVNSWCTYTVDKDGVYTLTEVDGKINTADGVKVAQYAAANHNTVIDQKHISLPGAASGSYSKVYGNDATVYLTASIKEIMTSGSRSDIIIDGVDSVTTGIKNANIQPWNKADAKAEAENDIKSETSSDNASGVYTLYKSNGYIIATVVVGEDAAASKNLVYVHSSNVEQEGYDKTADEWTWTRKVISDGKEIELKEVGDALTYIGSAAGEGNMKQYNWYQVKYNAEGEVISVELASSALKGNEYVTDIKNVETAVNDKDTVLYTQSFTADQPSMIGSTLFVSTKDKTGFFVAEDVNITLIQYVKNKQETTFETGVDELEKIVDDLNKENGKFDYTINAILEDGAATSVVIYDQANSYNDNPSNPDLKPGEFLPASWNGKAIELRYYGKPMTDTEVKAAIADLLGEPVARLNKILNFVEMENGDMYPVDFTQKEVVAMKFDGKILAYADKDGKVHTVEGIPAGDYMDIIANSTGVATKVSTVAKDGKLGVTANGDREFVTAYKVDLPASNVTAKLNDKDATAVNDNSYVAAGKTVVLTFTENTGDYTVNGNLVRTAGEAKDVVYEIEATEAITVATVSNYMTADEIATEVAKYEVPPSPAPTGCTITVDGTTLKIVLANTVTDISDRSQVKDTGLVDLATALIAKGNTVQMTFADGQGLKLTASNVATMAQMLKDNLGTLPMGDKTSTVTVTVTNTASGESMNYSVVISQAAK